MDNYNRGGWKLKMADKLDYRDEKIEQFAIEKLTVAYNSIYNDFIWNQKADDFDFFV